MFLFENSVISLIIKDNFEYITIYLAHKSFIYSFG